MTSKSRSSTIHDSRSARQSGKLTRRRFVQVSSAAAAGVIGFPAVLRSASPNSMLQVASIGVGGMGGNTMRSVAKHPKVKITALCDVDSSYLDAAAAVHTDASRHRDWREMLADHADRFDAVTIGTPDHMHAAPAVVALRAKKHLYLQKPMATTLHECRVITNEAAAAGVVTQLGNQGRSSVESRAAVALLRGGAIGKVREVIMWENKPLSWWPKNTELRANGDPIPKTLDWDLWLGVRQPTPYLANTYHPKNWRAWFDFGCGEMGDMGCHHFDTTFDALELTAPTRVRQTTPASSGPLWGKSRIVELIFLSGPHTAGDTLKITWHDGDISPQNVPMPPSVRELPRSGTCWIGERGFIFKPYGNAMPVVHRQDGFAADEYPNDIAPRDHYLDWVDAILEGRSACDEFSHGGPLTEAVLVGAAADRVAQQWLEWDAKAQRFSNSAEATALVQRTYRDGWKVEGLG